LTRALPTSGQRASMREWDIKSPVKADNIAYISSE
jgi:hypothetical protein